MREREPVLPEINSSPFSPCSSRASVFLSWPGAVTSRTVDLTPAVPGSPARCCPREAAQLIRGMPLLSRTCTSRRLADCRTTLAPKRQEHSRVLGGRGGALPVYVKNANPAAWRRIILPTADEVEVRALFRSHALCLGHVHPAECPRARILTSARRDPPREELHGSPAQDRVA
jgi:hypothetical protein